MKQIKYTPDAADKLRLLKQNIATRFGKEIAVSIIKTITEAIQNLAQNEKSGPSVEDMFDIHSEYRYIFVAKNYVFYRIEDSCIRVINIYNEREDFMWQLFGIDTTQQETIDYWKE